MAVHGKANLHENINMEQNINKTKSAETAIESSRLVRIPLDFQAYEIELIQESLELLYSKLQKSCKWERQPSGRFYYTPNKALKRVKFVRKSIRRQLDSFNANAQAMAPTGDKKERNHE